MLWLAAASFAADVEPAMLAELDRANEALKGRSDAPYYTALQIEDRTEWSIIAWDGTLGRSTKDRERTLDVDLRVGTPALDSTHEMRGFSAMEGDDRDIVLLPQSDDGYPLNHAIWRELDRSWRSARERIVMIRANQNVKVEEEVVANDFEPRSAVVDRQVIPELVIDTAAWEALLVDIDKRIEADPQVTSARVFLQADHTEKTFVDTEGTRLHHGGNHVRVAISLTAIASDGDEVSVFLSRDAHSLDKLPSADELVQWADQGVDDIHDLLASPRGTPYSGPVILSGRAAGVFFHEVFGHRVEGQRQKDENEGRTFAEMVGKPILPAFLDVVDDPTVASFGGIDLNGHYAYDDEGVPAQRAVLAEDGKFSGFLMQRSPIPKFDHSNGHGRRMAGRAPVARMGNTIVTADPKAVVTPAKLRDKLIAEAKAQGLPYGVIVDEIEGGFTLTGRVEPNAFNVRASKATLVYTDGRPDLLVRGIDLVGTPLVAFANIIAAGDDPDVFDGFCGAESGWVPVSAVAPSLLVRRLEFQLKEKGQDRPPLLPKPLPPEGSAMLEVTP